MKWLVALTLVVASASLLVRALQRTGETAQANTQLDRIHETAAV
jgi:hypothetical protein